MAKNEVETGDEYSPPPQYPIESVDNALRLLRLLETKPSIRLTDASNYLDVATSTAHRLLSMLQYRGFVRQNPATKAYEPGQALGAIARAIRQRVDVRSLVRPTLQRLNLETGETVHFVKLDGANVNFLDAVESSRAVRVASRQGMSLPANCTATGKAMLSTLSTDELRKLFPGEELPGLTRASITSRAELEQALVKIREAGYSSSHEESEDGVTSVGVAVRSPDGFIYGMNVSVPAHRMNEQLSGELAKLLVDSANEVQRILL
jgi:IclR family acetate operon transcriptional repressor